VDSWGAELELGSPAELLRRLGLHGLLTAVTLLGKLCRCGAA
jgi:hypothetical protein